MSQGYSISEAAEKLARPAMTIYAWAKSNPDLFTFEPRGKSRKTSITPENLEKLRALKVKPPAKAPVLTPRPKQNLMVPPKAVNPDPGYSLTPSIKPTNVRVQKVGWWCRECGDLMPDFRLVCRCLWAIGTDAAMERHRKKAWFPAYVDITVSAALGRK